MKKLQLSISLFLMVITFGYSQSFTLQPGTGLVTTNTLKNIHFYDGKLGIGSLYPSRGMFEIKNADNNIYSMSVTSSNGNDGVGRIAEFNTSDFVQSVSGTSLTMFFGSNTGNTYTDISVSTKGKSLGGNMSLQSNTGLLGVGTKFPKTKLHITNGDLYLESVYSGIILKSPNGTCWKLTVTDYGGISSSVVACP